MDEWCHTYECAKSHVCTNYATEMNDSCLEWYEWVTNDMNGSRMPWMSHEWYEWVTNYATEMNDLCLERRSHITRMNHVCQTRKNALANPYIPTRQTHVVCCSCVGVCCSCVGVCCSCVRVCWSYVGASQVTYFKSTRTKVPRFSIWREISPPSAPSRNPIAV